MIVVVDSNILFSAAISPAGKIAELLLQPLPDVQFVSCYYTLVELFKHQPKIVQLSKQPVEKVVLNLYALLRQLDLINESIIEQQHWKEADQLTKGVDSFDIAYVALTLSQDGWLWTGDKKLTNHLRSLGFTRILTTDDLYQQVFGSENAL